MPVVTAKNENIARKLLSSLEESLSRPDTWIFGDKPTLIAHLVIARMTDVGLDSLIPAKPKDYEVWAMQKPEWTEMMQRAKDHDYEVAGRKILVDAMAITWTVIIGKAPEQWHDRASGVLVSRTRILLGSSCSLTLNGKFFVEHRRNGKKNCVPPLKNSQDQRCASLFG